MSNKVAPVGLGELVGCRSDDLVVEGAIGIGNDVEGVPTVLHHQYRGLAVNEALRPQGVSAKERVAHIPRRSRQIRHVDARVWARALEGWMCLRDAPAV